MAPTDSVYEKATPYLSPPKDVPEFVSEADYWQFYYKHPDESYEWNNGKLETRPMSNKLSYILYVWFLRLLKEYFEVFPEGESMGQELTFAMDFDDKRVIRKPDLAIIHQDNPTPFELTDRSYKGTCDICIEFLSDSTKQEKERDTVQKKAEYAKAGVKEYFILDRLHKETAFYRLTQTGEGKLSSIYHPIEPYNGVIRSQVLSHFAFRLEHLRSRPDFKNLIDDPVYQPFIVKPLQEALHKAEQERLAREYEREAKERALGQAEQEKRTKEEGQRAKEAALKQAKEERLAREALEVELKQLREQIQKNEG